MVRLKINIITGYLINFQFYTKLVKTLQSTINFIFDFNHFLIIVLLQLHKLLYKYISTVITKDGFAFFSPIVIEDALAFAFCLRRFSPPFFCKVFSRTYSFRCAISSVYLTIGWCEFIKNVYISALLCVDGYYNGRYWKIAGKRKMVGTGKFWFTISVL